MEQIVDTPARGVLRGFFPGQVSSSSSRLLGDADEGIQGFFRTFPKFKKSAGMGPHSGSELSADFTPSTAAAYVDSDGPLTCGLTTLGKLGGSRRLAGGTWSGTLLFGGTLLGDVVAAAWGGACGAVPGLGGRRPCCAGRPVGASSPWTRLLTCPLLSTTVEVVDVPAAVHRQGVDVPAVLQ